MGKFYGFLDCDIAYAIVVMLMSNNAMSPSITILPNPPSLPCSCTNEIRSDARHGGMVKNNNPDARKVRIMMMYFALELD
jgi:hypothetical protein